MENEPALPKSPTKDDIDDMFGSISQAIKNKTQQEWKFGGRNAGMVTGITKAS